MEDHYESNFINGELEAQRGLTALPRSGNKKGRKKLVPISSNLPHYPEGHATAWPFL